MKKRNDIISKVAEDFELTVVDATIVTDLAKRCGIPDDWLDEASYICGKEVTLGRYKDESVRLASFFHEVGHTVKPRLDTTGVAEKFGLGEWKFRVEKDAWDKGIVLAKKYGVIFSDAAVHFMKRCLDKALEYRG